MNFSKKTNIFIFLSLLIIILFFGFSFAYLINSILLISLPTYGSFKLTKNLILEDENHSSKSANIYEETVFGNMIRGTNWSPEKEKTIDTGYTELDEPELDELLLTGILSGNKSFARVTFKPKNKDEADEFGIGDYIFKYKVLKINKSSVTLFKDKKELMVNIGETIGDTKKRLNHVIYRNSQNSKNCINIEKLLSRTKFEGYLRNLNDIYKNARFGPNFIDNKMDGIILSQIPSNHLFYILGARNGDIVKRVNGMPLIETEKMLEIWSNIKNASRVEIDIDRKGNCYIFNFSIRN